MIDLTGTIVLWSIPVLATAMILIDDKRMMDERKAKAAQGKK